MRHDIHDPIVQLISLLEEVVVTGPDFDGWVRLTCTPPDGDPLSLSLGQIGEPAADAALLWRTEVSPVLDLHPVEDEPLHDMLHHMDVGGPFGGDIGDED